MTAATAGADVCTLDQVQERNADLPPFIPVDEGVSPAATMADQLGCETVIEDADEVAAAEREVREAEVSVSSARVQLQETMNETPAEEVERSQQSVAAQERQSSAGQQQQSSAGQQQQAQVTTSSEFEQAAAAEREKTAQLMEQADADLAEASSLLESLLKPLEELWERGLLPIKRIAIQMQSEPINAAVFVDDKFAGRTLVQGVVEESYLQTIRMELEGYDTCRFADGVFLTYKETEGDFARFVCTLRTRP